MKSFMSLIFLGICITLSGQVVEVQPVFPKVNDDVTITFNAAEGNGALFGVTPVYAHTGLITSESQAPGDWKHVQGNWGTADPKVLMTSIGNNKHTISYNIHDFYGVNDGEVVEELAFVFRNANGSIVGRAGDGADIFYPVYPDNVDFLSILLSPQQSSLALFENEVLLIKGATSQDADLYFVDNEDTIATTFGNYLEYNLTINEPGNHDVQFIAIQGADTLVESFFYTVIINVMVENPPAGREPGITVTSDTSVHFQLYAPNKSVVHLIGDATDWDPRSEYQMKRSEDATTWWIEISGLDAGSQYRFQYLVDGEIRIGDPYSALVLDRFNDGQIDEVTFPDKPDYPNGLTTGIVSVFSMDSVLKTPTLHPKPANADLIIYELLLRDFLHAHSFAALRDTLDYLQRLGVNAVQIMPVNEFEGNYGWGYNPSYHLALDKFYGPESEFRSLIDEIHSRGMVVILDVVYNHAFGQSPLAQLYWDDANNRPSPNNPWLNPVAKHDFNVGYDFNHESAQTRYFVKRAISWWLETYGVDGFRFDLSKGFTQKNTLGNIEAWGQFDQSRINILQDYADHAWSIDPEAYIILEHFADNAEEKELSSRGMMLWGNMNHAFSQASMSYTGSDFSGAWHVQRGWTEPHLVAYMESHDEERIMRRNLTSGASAGNYNIKQLNTALARIELISTFFHLIPGPKMIWEFGELGYDYSINYCVDGSINNNCRLDPKPIRWDYLYQPKRKRVYDITRAVIALREQEAFKEGNLTINFASQNEKKLSFTHSDMDIVAVGNFSVGGRTIKPGFTRTGWWYDYLGTDSLLVTKLDTQFLFKAGEYYVFTTKKVDVGFDIETSIKENHIISRPLVIHPTIHEGSFTISIPDEMREIKNLAISDLKGIHFPVTWHREGNEIIAQIEAPTGMYIVQVVTPGVHYTGKMVVQ